MRVSGKLHAAFSMGKFSVDDIHDFFRSDDRDLLEDMAQAARALTRQYFGRAVALYAPLYIANFCRNRCAYCGFQARSRIARKKLTFDEIHRECAALAATGIQSCLILTGESRYQSPPEYIAEAVRIAGKYFSNVGLEIYPLETEEYRELYRAGADGVTLFQETYDRKRYDELHLAGPKKNYDYRVGAPERIASAGFRQISLGVLLGLTDWREDVMRLFSHLRSLESEFPGVEYTLSFPRLRPLAEDTGRYWDVTDRDMVKIICAARLVFPRVGINLSTRESASFRDRIVDLGVTKMSAGSLTTVGGYAADEAERDEEGQFSIHDPRSLAQIKSMLSGKGFDPVMTDWRSIVNE